MNSNPLPKHAVGSNGVNAVEVGNKERALKVTMTKLYDMLVQSRHLEKSTEYSMGKNNFCPFHNKKEHHIDEYMEFHQKVTRMLTLGELRIEVVEENRGKIVIEKCRIQSTVNGLSKLILTKPSYAKKADCRAMPDNYVSTSNVKTPFFPNQDKRVDPEWPLFHVRGFGKAKKS